MQSGLSQRAAEAGPVGAISCLARLRPMLLAPVMGLALSACVGSGQLANLTESRRAAVAFESIDGPPPAVVHKFVQTLKDEAGVRQIGVVASGEANYRLRGYLAAHNAGAATVISWALDVYDTDQHHAFRLSGEERANGRAGDRSWAAADDQVLHRIASAGMTQLAAFLSNARPAAANAAPTTSSPRASALAWLDDWTPEAAGIFRILRNAPARPPEIAADASPAMARETVPLPARRPVPAGGVGNGSAVALAAADLDR
jgi:hypothetical protein